MSFHAIREARFVRKARYEFSQWRKRLSVFKARHCLPSEPDPPVPAFVIVQPQDAIRVFVELNPKFRGLESSIEEAIVDRLTFQFDQIKWAAISVA